MLSNDQKQRIIKIAQKNGTHTTRNKSLEEVAEYKEALESNDTYAIIDEIADILITAYQEIYHLNIKKEVEDRLEHKIARTEQRLSICN